MREEQDFFEILCNVDSGFMELHKTIFSITLFASSGGSG